MTKLILEAFLLELMPKLIRAAMAWLHDADAAEEVAAKAVCKYLEKIKDGTAATIANPAGFLMNCVKFGCMDVFRRQKRCRNQDNFDDLPSFFFDDAMTAMEIQDEISTRLGETSFIIFRMRRIDNCNVGEIAAATGLTPSAVYRELVKIRNVLSEAYLPA